MFSRWSAREKFCEDVRPAFKNAVHWQARKQTGKSQGPRSGKQRDQVRAGLTPVRLVVQDSRLNIEINIIMYT